MPRVAKAFWMSWTLTSSFKTSNKGTVKTLPPEVYSKNTGWICTHLWYYSPTKWSSECCEGLDKNNNPWLSRDHSETRPCHGCQDETVPMQSIKVGLAPNAPDYFHRLIMTDLIFCYIFIDFWKQQSFQFEHNSLCHWFLAKPPKNSSGDLHRKLITPARNSVYETSVRTVCPAFRLILAVLNFSKLYRFVGCLLYIIHYDSIVLIYLNTLRLQAHMMGDVENFANREHQSDSFQVCGWPSSTIFAYNVCSSQATMDTKSRYVVRHIYIL